jgi:hypothetical protein
MVHIGFMSSKTNCYAYYLAGAKNPENQYGSRRLGEFAGMTGQGMKMNGTANVNICGRS